LLALLWALAADAGTEVTRLEDDERLLFFPSVCFPAGGSNRWVLQIQGCVYEPSRSVYSMKALEKMLAAYGTRLNGTESGIFEDRARLFMADNKSGRRVFVRCAGADYELGQTRKNGHFSGEIALEGTAATALGLPDTNRIYVQALLPPGRELVRGNITVIPAVGWIVVSDIDDTIKLTLVNHRQVMLRHTFLEPFKPIEGMSALYKRWAAEANARFFYLSGSPWQLYEPLAEFIHAEDFPAGVFSLKEFRLKDRSVRSLWADPERYKTEGIEPLLKQFERHMFVLVGDSGEKDPEAYGALARRHPEQVGKILIRNVTAEPQSAPRYRKAFAGVPESKWIVFRDPATLTNILPASVGSSSQEGAAR